MTKQRHRGKVPVRGAVMLGLFVLALAAHGEELLRTNLHVRTALSAPGAQSPAETLSTARALGLDCVGLADLKGNLNASRWQELGEAATAAPEGLTALRGFTWTGRAGSSAVFGSDGFMPNNATYSSLKQTLGSPLENFFTWLIRVRNRPQRYVAMAQLNDVASATRFNDFAPGPNATVLRMAVVTAELATGTPTPAALATGEAAFRQALAMGWRVAPTLGADNTGPLDTSARRYHTGVFYRPDGGNRTKDILNTILRHRIFASTDENASLRFEVAGQPTGSSGLTPAAPVRMTVRYEEPDSPATCDAVTGTVLVVNGVESALPVAPVRENGTWLWRFECPLAPGNKWAYVRIRQADGDQLWSAPTWFSLPTYRFVRGFGNWGQGNGQLNFPEDVAVDTDGTVYVADTVECRVQKLTAEGGFLAKWGRRGGGYNQLQYPHSLALGGSGSLYVADTYNHRIKQYTTAGRFLRQWGTRGADPGQFNYPHGVAVDRQGSVYVADTLNHRIQKFGPHGRFLAQWGGYGSKRGQFNNPRSLEVDAAGNIYVMDCGNYRVQKLGPDGTPRLSFGGLGMIDGRFSQPIGLALDAAGNIYVSDADLCNVQKFDATGRFVTSWGRRGEDPGELHDPTGVCVSATGEVYVTHMSNHVRSVVVFADSSGGKTPQAAQKRPLVCSTLTVAPVAGGGSQIGFTLSAPAAVRVRVLNLSGVPVRTLATAGQTAAGTITLLWDGRAGSGTKAPTGSYLVELTACGDDGTQVRRLCGLRVKL